MNILIKDANKELVKVIKSVAKIANAKCKVTKAPEDKSKAKQWKRESIQMIEDYKAGKIKGYESAKEMHKAIFEND